MTDQPALQDPEAAAQALRDRLRHDFTNHPPRDDYIVKLFEDCRDAALEMGDMLIDCCPPSRELSLALTHLEESLMYARAAIARHQDRIAGGEQEAQERAEKPAEEPVDPEDLKKLEEVTLPPVEDVERDNEALQRLTDWGVPEPDDAELPVVVPRDPAQASEADEV